MAELNEFDNIQNIDEPKSNNDGDAERKKSDGLQKVIKTITCLPCFPKYEPKPDTPNIDQLKQILDRFRNEDSGETNVDVVERSKSDELSDWTNKVLEYLPGIEDAPEGTEGTHQISSHFLTIKKFYEVAQKAGFESSELDSVFNSLQIYESVMPLAFIVFNDHPDTLKSLTENIELAIGKVENHGTQGCLAMALCGAALLSKFNSILKVIDDLIGQFGIASVAEFIMNLIEVFCKYFNIDLSDADKLASLSDSLQSLITVISKKLSKMFGDIVPDVEREKKWGPLRITQKIKDKLDEFDSGSVIVERTMQSFEKFFEAVEKIDDKYQAKSTQRSVPIDVETIEGEDMDFRKEDVSNQALSARINKDADNAFSEITQVAKVFQYIETILSYGILVFKNEDEILNPLLDLVDECTRILVKFFTLHPLYQIVLGTNYLSKLKVMLKEIIELLKESKLKFNSPKEFLSEIKSQYPDLIYILCKDLLDDKLKKKLKFLPDDLEEAVNGAIDSALDKFKDKFGL